MGSEKRFLSLKKSEKILPPNASQELERLSLDAKVIANTMKNESLCFSLLEILQEAEQERGMTFDKTTGNLLYRLGAQCPASALSHRPLIAEYVGSKKISAVPQLEAALEFVERLGDRQLEVTSFESACGVGIEISEEELRTGVEQVLMVHKAEIEEQRYRTNFGKLMASVKDLNSRLRWVDGKALKTEVTKQLEAFLGPRTAVNEEPSRGKSKIKTKTKSIKPANTESKSSSSETQSLEGAAGRFSDPEENFQNRTDILKKHLISTGGKTITRFPPEPNGYLHIGHAKAMNLNFGFATAKNGMCFLRFDDTNPEKESQEFIDSIISDVTWLGHQPVQITYSSDYFDQLYELCKELIRRDKAFVCHQTAEEMAEGRRTHTPSPWRNRPVAESLKIFEDMKRGLYGEGEAVVRMKQDMQSPNPNMWDHVAFRVKMHPHPRTGDKWCVYPSYDFTHCIVDSLENITHSLCTLEFESRRESYLWLLDALDLYKPVVWEYSRLNLEATVLSKRKLTRLVEDGFVDGWDDPRLFTISALRRRGFTPDGINKFCEEIGVTRRGTLVHSPSLLETICRGDLDEKCVRAMAVLRPLRIILTNVQGKHVLSIPNHPKKPEMGNHEIYFAPEIAVERSDFRLEDSKDYYGLAPNKEVGLKYNGVIRCDEVTKNENGEVIELKATYFSPEEARAMGKKPKGHLHWVAYNGGTKATVHLYEPLFKSSNPSDSQDFTEDINPNSKETITDALVDACVSSAAVGARFQFERLGYFVIDSKDFDGKFIINRTTGLRDKFNPKK